MAVEFSLFNFRALIGNESTVFVRTIAEGLIRGVAAATEGDSWLVGAE